MQSALSETIVQRVIGAARLDGAVYEEVEHDINASSQALMIVGVAAVSAAIGGLADGWQGLVASLISVVISFAASSYFVYFVGTRLTPSTQTSANYGEVMRCLGFAYAPNLLLILYIIPGIGGLLAFLIGIWATVARIVAIMHALEMSVARAIGTSILASIIELVVALILAGLIGGTAIGLGALF